MNRNRRFAAAFWSIATLFALAAAPAISRAADAPKDSGKKDAAKSELKTIKPEEAKDYEGKEVAVEFKVAGSREIASGVCFLNSTTDRNDPAGFTAFIGKDGETKLKSDGLKAGDKTDSKADSKTAAKSDSKSDAKAETKGIEKPAVFFKGKTIRVTGKVKKYQDKFEIEVNSPDQITVLEEKSDKEKSEKKDSKK